MEEFRGQCTSLFAVLREIDPPFMALLVVPKSNPA